MMRKENGQLYSLDFLISVGLLVLAIGLTLNFYETTAYQEKEARTRNELNTIALTAANILAAKSTCPEAAFSAQGYRAYGCYDRAKLSGISKSDLLIPADMSCLVKRGNNIENLKAPGCAQSEPPPTTTDVASVERPLLVPATAPLTKTTYEKCIAQACDSYVEETLTVKVWR